jgi:glycosyltransferase involved in cell wall biosynthesis
MRIIYLHQYFNTPFMKGGVRSYDIASHLVKKNHEVHIITTWREQSDTKEWIKSTEDGINVHWLPLSYSNHLSYRSRLAVFFRFAWKSYFYAKKLEADIVFATSTPLTIAIPALFLSSKKSIPMVFEVRDLWPDVAIAVGALKNPLFKFIAKLVENKAYKKSEAVIALSHGMKKGIIKKGYPEERIAVITNFSNNSLFYQTSVFQDTFRSSRKWLKSRPLLVYTGSFGLINGLSYLIELAEQLQKIESDVRILLIGDGREYDHLISYSKEKKVLGNNFFIESEIQKSDLPYVLAAADLASNIVINNPDVWNNSANKFFDALASGTPLLVNDNGWQADLIEQTGSGISSRLMPIKEVASLVDKLLHDHEWKRLAGKNAKNLAETYFDKNALVDKVENILLASFQNNGQRASKIGLGLFNYNDKEK